MSQETNLERVRLSKKGNAVWVDQDTDSLLALFQYIMNTSDTMLNDLFLRYTFEEYSDILSIMAEHENDKGKRIGQFKLASILVEMVSGSSQMSRMIGNYRNYFSLDYTELVS